MSNLICTAQLLQRVVTYKELNFLQYRQLLKCFLGEEVFSEIIFTNTDNILKELTNLTQHEIDSLSFLDYCLLLFDIRLTSIGDIVFLYVDSPDQKQIKIDLQINNVLDQINCNEIQKLLEPETVDNYKIEYRLPSIKEILILEQNKEVYSPYTFFLKKANLSNIVINLEDYSFLEREKIVQNIPIKVMTALTKRSHHLIDFCNQLNLLKSIKNNMFDKELILTLNSEIIAFIIKLFYNTRLDTIYEYMFALSKMANISGSFLNSCSPGEFYIFAKKLEEYNAKTQHSNKARLSDSLPPVHSEAEFGMNGME